MTPRDLRRALIRAISGHSCVLVKICLIMTSNIRVDISESIATLTVDRPSVKNALNLETVDELHLALDGLAGNADVGVVIVTGAGESSFVSGADINDIRTRNGSDGLAAINSSLFAKIDRFPKPVIAAVNGYALGGGLEIALACDIVVAAETATFGLPEVKRGIVAGGGGMYRLPRQLPLKIAMGYLLTGKTMTAAEAHGWGLVNEVVPAPGLMDAANRWAAEIIEAAPLSVRATKQAALAGLDMTLEDAYNEPFLALQVMRDSKDSREGVLAFTERRKPNWTGT